MTLVLGMHAAAYGDTYPAYGEDSYKTKHDKYTSIDVNEFYLGLGYAYTFANVNVPDRYLGKGYDMDIQSDNLFFVAGYDINKYVAVETRYTFSTTDLDFDFNGYTTSGGMSWGGDISNVGLYVKPKYSVEDVTVYALLGYGHIRVDIDNIGDHSENEFQWGAGISMDVGNSIINNTKTLFFLDYMKYLDGENGQISYSVESINAGIAFKF